MVVKNSVEDIKTGGGYKDFKLRELHRLWYKAYVVSGSRSGAMLKKERENPAFKRFVDYLRANPKGFKRDIIDDFYRQRIKMGKAFYGNTKARLPNTFTTANVKKYGAYRPPPVAKFSRADIVKFKAINKQKKLKRDSKIKARAEMVGFNVKNTNVIFGRTNKVGARRNLKREGSAPVMASREIRLKAQRKAQIRENLKAGKTTQPSKAQQLKNQRKKQLRESLKVGYPK